MAPGAQHGHPSSPPASGSAGGKSQACPSGIFQLPSTHHGACPGSGSRLSNWGRLKGGSPGGLEGQTPGWCLVERSQGRGEDGAPWEPATPGTCSWAWGLGVPDAARDWVRDPETPREGCQLWFKAGAECPQGCRPPTPTPNPALLVGRGIFPSMASILRASRVAHAGASMAGGPRTTTSSTVPMPMALPRRPNLLALFPGISNDWQAARVGQRKKQRKGLRRGMGWAETKKRVVGAGKDMEPGKERGEAGGDGPRTEWQAEQGPCARASQRRHARHEGTWRGPDGGVRDTDTGKGHSRYRDRRVRGQG